MNIPLIFRCDECGIDLKADFVQDYSGNNIIHVQLCPYCMEMIVEETRNDIENWVNDV